MKSLTLTLFLLLLSVCGTFAGLNKCLLSNGFSTSYFANSFETNAAGSQPQTTGFYETGSLNIDFINGVFALNFQTISQDTVKTGSVYMFDKNNTIYIVNVDDNGNTRCQLGASNSKVPSNYFNISSDLGPINVGAFPTELLRIESFLDVESDQDIIYDFQNCAMVSSFIKKQETDYLAVSVINYLDYQNHPTQFSLPEECISAQPSLIRRNIISHFPRSLKYHLKPFF
ncbi:hypothetical protein CYY_007976 [Polysphondylium violaceum]|uniref:Uncharacterized protein n=1 Tax=Polysphondylium violaceum TaxID=133409 RepID=A0A8J4V4G6_9MYCE|nr:hypothetical protein CYY_007976 [Polysphondylium violaceum]